MSEENLFAKFSNLMDQNIRGVQYGVYTIAGIGLCVALRSVRPFKKFQRPSDIPKHFIEKKMRFSGKVTKIQGQKSPVLYVDHYPVVSLPFRNSTGALPVQISGVEVTGNGGIWLNTMLQGTDINFIPLRVDQQVAHSIVYRGKQDVGKHLVSIGFGTVSGLDFNLEKEKVYDKYYKGLISSEKVAESRGAGIWQDQKGLSHDNNNKRIDMMHVVYLCVGMRRKFYIHDIYKYVVASGWKGKSLSHVVGSDTVDIISSSFDLKSGDVEIRRGCFSVEIYS